jgi:osmotically-inducible protein OsmY
MNSLTLEESVIEELAFDPQISSDDISVSVSAGIVTLRGTVPNITQLWQAANAVKRVRGVIGVVDDLTVELLGTHVRNDRDIARDIQRRLAANPIVPKRIQFVVRDAVIRLTGETDWRFVRQEIEDIVRGVVGVRLIENVIAVRPQPLNADDVKSTIISAFARVRDPASTIDVSVDDGTVVLTGATTAWVQRDHAERIAWSIPGVTYVDNRIVVAA